MLQGQDKQWLDEVFEKVCRKMEWVREKSKDKIPSGVDSNGTHDDRSVTNVRNRDDDGICWWTNGFWGGILWLMYEQTGDERYAEIANISEDKLDQAFEQYYGLHHDVGFMWVPTSVANYRLTGNPKSRKRGLLAANLLAGRFNTVGEFIRAWNDTPDGDDTRGWAIIDCMFNISLLYWASEETDDPRFRQIAMKHADTAMKAFIRPDGSVNHIVEFDPETGEVVTNYGGQGYCKGSSWTRGQTWAIYGFTISYLHTGKQEYLDAAKRVAHYFIANIPENGIIPIDFRQPKEPAWEDSIAACVAAGAFIEISKLVGEHEKDLFLGAALKLLKALDQSGRVNYGEDCDCFVQNGSGAYNSPVKHEPYVYCDYYYIEALCKLRGSEFRIW